ncbi:hypothetical protein LTR50_005311 [Elasticomyces elasticus]|nr:hypothetical protein LTR50_005311 [Elasticomyces elasticus]
MTGLKVVGLISGGKDSLFSLLHCIANGHDIVALANLYPPENNRENISEDLDSFMYQTVGHTVIPLYQHALDLPLYRQEILGTAVNQDKSYSTNDENHRAVEPDETESLVPLLQKVMAAHPEVNAVSTGAILSDYQRTRVEAIAIRLGLIPLSYLWQWPYLPPYTQTSLLEDMQSVKQDARIIKVASGGLDASFLWNNVADARTKKRLIRSMDRFGGNQGGAVLGEGGEYETLAIDGPPPLWKARIEIGAEDRVAVEGEGGTASLKILNASVVGKDAPAPGGTRSDTNDVAPRIPSLFDDSFQDGLNCVEAFEPQISAVEGAESSHTKLPQPVPLASWQIASFMQVARVANMTMEGSSAVEQMTSIARHLDAVLSEIEWELNDTVFTTIILRRMSDFATVNRLYGTWFSGPSPPARVTIASGEILPVGVEVMLSLDLAKRNSGQPRQGLHVQSRSYWAPANIGPYSQAISVPCETASQSTCTSSVVHVAGQIALVPASMELLSTQGSTERDGFRVQTVLALQHLWRIGKATNVVQWLGAVAFITANTYTQAVSRAQIASLAWLKAHAVHLESLGEEDDKSPADLDVWDLRSRGALQHTSPSKSALSNRLGAGIGITPPCFVVQVEELPRGASIEWSSTGITGEAVDQIDQGLPTFSECVIRAP